MGDMITGTVWTYVIPIVIAVVILGFFYYRSKKAVPRESKTGEEEKEEEKEEKGKPILARIWCVERRIVGNRELSYKIAKEIITKHGNLGRQRLREGKQLYSLVLNNDIYTPVEVPQAMSKIPTPRDLGNALTQDEIAGWYRPQPAQGGFSKYGPILLWSGAIIFIIFMMVTK